MLACLKGGSPVYELRSAQYTCARESRFKNAMAARLPFISKPARVARFAINVLHTALGPVTLCRKRGKDMLEGTLWSWTMSLQSENSVWQMEIGRAHV